MARNGNAKTRRFALNMLKVSVAISGAALLFACGDDDSSFVASENGGSAAEADIVVAIFDDLPNCTGKREGVTAYVKDEKTAYICTDGDWVVAGESGDEGDDDDDDGDNAEKKSSSSTAKSADSKGKSSSSDKEVSSSSVTLSEVEGSSSSSVIPGSDPESSSSVESSSSKAKASSSDGNDDGKSSSSSTAKSSSSEGGGGASSSSVIASSSSEELVSSSSFNKFSSSSRGFFDMTKDEFLNPKITYGSMKDTRDNKTYKTVEICNKDKSECQTWMAENLNYADSTKMPGQSWCYDDKAENCDVAGRLYTWAAAIDSVALANDADNPQTCGYGKTCTLPTVVQGVCPEGWHLPSNDEWRTLFTAVGGEDNAGTALKSQTGWYSQTGDAADRDAYGFSALPAGYRKDTGNFSNAGYSADFWSASEYYSSYAYYMLLDYSYGFADLSYKSKDRGYSVRCLQN